MESSATVGFLSSTSADVSPLGNSLGRGLDLCHLSFEFVLPPKANLNFVNTFYVKQDFEKSMVNGLMCVIICALGFHL